MILSFLDHLEIERRCGAPRDRHASAAVGCRHHGHRHVARS
jgi:hypothetical protein